MAAGLPILRDVSKDVPAPAPASAPASLPRSITPPADAEGAEGKLLRVLQRMMTAYSAGSIPTPRERAAISRDAHEAIEAYLVSKLAASGGRR